MSRVPVGASIAHAYEFLLGRFFQIIGTAWVPAVLAGTGYYVFLTQEKAVGHPADAAAAGSLVALALGAIVFFLMIRSVIGISLTQEALGVRKDMTLAHFVIGPRELRLFFGYLLFTLLFIALYIVVIAVAIGIVLLAKTYGDGLVPKFAPGGIHLATIAAMVVTVALILWFFLSMLRLGFLLAPVAAAEHRLRLSRAWDLTRGSTWRIFAVVLVTFVPVAIAGCAALFYLIGPADFGALMKAMHGWRPGTPPPTVGFLASHAGIMSLYVAVMAVLNGALLAGASAHAYRVTSGHEDPELEDDAAIVAPLIGPEPVHKEHVHEEPPADHGHHGHEQQDHEDHGHGSHGDDSAGEGAASDDQGSHDHGSHDNHGHGGHEEHGHGDHGHDEHAHDDHGHHAQASASGPALTDFIAIAPADHALADDQAAA